MEDMMEGTSRKALMLGAAIAAVLPPAGYMPPAQPGPSHTTFRKGTPARGKARKQHRNAQGRRFTEVDQPDPDEEQLKAMLHRMTRNQMKKYRRALEDGTERLVSTRERLVVASDVLGAEA